MSEDQTPEWIRLKREIEAQISGVWEAVARIEDRLFELEKQQGTKPTRWPRNGWWADKPPRL